MVNNSYNEGMAIIALVTRYVKTFEARKADQALIDKLTERVALANTTMVQLKSAFALFDIDTTKEGVWQTVIERVGGLNWNEALAEGKRQADAMAYFPGMGPPPPPPLPPPPPSPPPTPPSEKPNVSASEPDEEASDLFEGDDIPAPESVREFTLNTLKWAGSEGIKAGAIRASYEATRDTKLHDKTIGMTLYRLSKETPPLARREGRTWFFVEQSSETKNPGGETPGLTEDVFK